ncbi:20177_t:CDS:2 [Funneliformis geosporum]|nr:20177_t:CDS:2 [Funneliformis geosporum]
MARYLPQKFHGLAESEVEADAEINVNISQAKKSEERAGPKEIAYSYYLLTEEEIKSLQVS